MEQSGKMESLMFTANGASAIDHIQRGNCNDNCRLLSADWFFALSNEAGLLLVGRAGECLMDDVLTFAMIQVDRSSTPVLWIYCGIFHMGTSHGIK